MCPDIETFAPLIQATFGAGEAADDDDELQAIPAELRPPDLRVRLADRSLRQTNPMLGVAGRLIDLAEQRLTASQVLDLADREPVRRRFRFDDDDLARLEDWVAESGIRWGLDAEHREPVQARRAARGHVAGGAGPGAARRDDDRGGAPAARRRAAARRRRQRRDRPRGAVRRAASTALRDAVDSLRDPKPIAAWAQAIADAADALAVAGPRETWQRAELQRVLAEVVGESGRQRHAAGARRGRARCSPTASRAARRAPTSAPGSLTVCTLVPMRSVPHRVVCLLGLDDGEFPRKAPRDGDDLMLREPHVGDRDARTEDRQMLLDALMAATDRLIVTYTGNDERTNARRPPAVPVGELLDVVDRTARAGGEARDRVLVRHPLQPFDPRNFGGARAVGVRPHDARRRRRRWPATGPSPRRSSPGPLLAARRGGRRARGPGALRAPPGARVPAPPPRRHRRRVRRRGRGRAAVELDGLGRWSVGERMLQRAAGGRGPARRDPRRDRARARSRPARSAGRRSSASSRTSTRSSQRSEKLDAGRGRLGRRAGARSAGGLISGTVPDVCGDVLRTVTLLARRTRGTGSRPGCGCSR